MVAVVKSISNSANATKYFYFIETEFALSKNWHPSKAVENLGFTELRKQNFTDALDGKIGDVVLGRKTAEGIAHHPGNELILSAPKSISIMAMIADDKRLVDAHIEAVGSVLDYVQKHCLFARITEDGQTKLVKVDNALIARFDHFTARPVEGQESNVTEIDPQLHTHCLIANATLCADGQWRSIVYDALYQHKMFLGEIYRRELAHNVKKLGYEIAEGKNKGYFSFEIEGVLTDVIKEFSKRREDILTKAAEKGVANAEDLALIAKTSRKEKQIPGEAELVEQWTKRCNAHGGGVEVLKNLVYNALAHAATNVVIDPTAKVEKAYKFALEHSSEREAAWLREDIFKLVFAKAGFDSNIKSVDALLEKKIDAGKLLVRQDKCTNYFTTAENIQQERYTINLMRQLQGKVKPIMAAAELDMRLKETQLSQGAGDAVKLIMSSHDQVVAIQGSAGSGKTTVLRQVRELAQEQGYEILGLAPTRDAATVFKDSTGAQAQTLQLFLIKRAGVLAGRGTAKGLASLRQELHKKIVILDEASLASTYQIRDLLKLSAILQFRLVLQGDTRQLGAVENGKPFYYLQDNGMDSVIMGQIKRQLNEPLRDSVYLAEAAVTQPEYAANKLVMRALEKIGEHNIIDVMEEEKKAAEEAASKGDGSTANKGNINAGGQLTKEDNKQALKAIDIAANTDDKKEKKDQEQGPPIVVDNDKLVKYLVAAWEEKHKAKHEILVVVPSNPLRRLANEEIRKHFVAASSNQVTHYILTRRNLTKAELKEAEYYTPGNILLFRKEDKELNIKENEYLEVETVCKNSGELTLKREESDVLIWRPDSLANRKKDMPELYKSEEITLQAGEKIHWTHNSPKNKFIVNGARATVLEVTDKEATIKDAQGKVHVMELTHPDMQHLDHDYVSTTYKAQGKGDDHVIGIIRAKELHLQLSTLRALYIIISRSRNGVTIITDNLSELSTEIGKKPGDKSLAILHTTQLPIAKSSIKLYKQGREVILKKSPTSFSRQPFNKLNASAGQTAAYPFSPAGRYEDFLRNPELIRSIAVEVFGQYNKNSKYDKLRFGDKSKVLVDVQTGRWYDFSKAEGGSLYQIYKERFSSSYAISPTNPGFILSASKQSTAEQEKWKKENMLATIKKSINIQEKEAEWGQRYLQENRKIDWQSIKLSDDIRFVNGLKAHENKKNYPALISIARDSQGEARGMQIIYLDRQKPEKSSELETVKRSHGQIQGNFVEVTTNKAANIVFIAEGLETALSIAQSQNKARVICSLGISNIKNIDFTKEKDWYNKQIIICADNDGYAANTNIVIEQAALAIKAQGVYTVRVIRPSEVGKDFNDVLKIGGSGWVNTYIKPILSAMDIEYQKQFIALEQKLITIKEELKAIRPTKIADFSIYRDPQMAFNKCRSLLENEGLKNTIEQLKTQPQTLGKLQGIDLHFWQSPARKRALVCTGNSINDISRQIMQHKRYGILNAQYQQLKLQHEREKQKFCHEQLGFLASFNSSQLDFTQLCQKLGVPVQYSLAAIDKRSDFEMTKYVTEKLAEQILYYRNRYGKEAPAYDKYNFFLRAYFEANRRPQIQSYLMHKLKPHNAGDFFLLQQKLERMLAIDSKLADSSGIFWRSTKLTKVINEFNVGQQKVKKLTAEYLEQGMSEIKARFVAHAVVQYVEKHGVNMPLKHIEAAKQVGTYVYNNYQALRRAGLSSKEAQIVFSEGYKMLIYHDKRLLQPAISKDEVTQIQQQSKQQMMVLNNNIKTTYKTPAIANGGMEIGD